MGQKEGFLSARRAGEDRHQDQSIATVADEPVRLGRLTPLRYGNPSGCISSSQEEEDVGATPIPEEDRGLTVEDVFGRSEEEEMLGDPEVEHAEVTEAANGGLGFDMVAGEEEVQAGIVLEEDEEGVVSRGMRPPQRVSKQERDEHERTHLPYRDWCDKSVKARGRRVAQRRGNKEERGQVPRVSMDHFYMSSKDEQDGNWC